MIVDLDARQARPSDRYLVIFLVVLGYTDPPLRPAIPPLDSKHDLIRGLRSD